MRNERAKNRRDMQQEKVEMESQFQYQVDIVFMEDIEEAVKKEILSIIEELMKLEKVTHMKLWNAWSLKQLYQFALK